MNIIDAQVYFLTQRVDKLEKKVFRSNRKPITLAQQILIIKHTGLLNKMTFDSKTMEAKFISALLDEDEKNTNTYLNLLVKKSPKIISKTNYLFLVETFKDLGLSKEMKECQLILNKFPS